MKKKYGRLGFVDLEMVKTSLLSKWIVKSMVSGESNFQLMLRYRLCRYNLQKWRRWEVSLDWFTNKLHQGLLAQEFGVILARRRRPWLRRSTKYRPYTDGAPSLQYLVLEGLELINKGFDYERGRQLYRKGIRRIEDIWNVAQQNFLTWEQVQEKFHLTGMKEGEWLDVIDKVSEQWWYLLETEENLAYPGQWVEFYEDEKSDPPFVLRCVTDYTPVLLERYNIFHPLPV